MTNPYSVVKAFRTTTAISGRERQFKPGDTFLCDAALPGETVIVEADEFLFIVDRATFNAYCKWKNEGMPA
jgi:hypothetical protein